MKRWRPIFALQQAGSRFRRNLAKKTRDHRTVADIDAIPREQRRLLLLQAWRDSRPALRDFFQVVERYLELREVHDEAETKRIGKQAAKLLDLKKPHSVEALLRELRKAWKAYDTASDALDQEEARVRALYPPYPVMKEVEGTAERPLTVWATRADIETWKERGELSAEQARDDLAALERWQAKCRAIDQLNQDGSPDRAEYVTTARYEAIRVLLIASRSQALKDVVAKLRFVDEEMFDDHYPAAKLAVAGLIKDLSKRVGEEKVARGTPRRSGSRARPSARWRM